MFNGTAFSTYNSPTATLAEPKSAVLATRPVLVNHSSFRSNLAKVDGDPGAARSLAAGGALKIYRYEPAFQYTTIVHPNRSVDQNTASAISFVFTKFDADGPDDLAAYAVAGVAAQDVAEPTAGSQCEIFLSANNLPLRWNSHNLTPMPGHTVVAFPPGMFPGRGVTGRDYLRPISGVGADGTAAWPHMGTLEEFFGAHVSSAMHRVAFNEAQFMLRNLSIQGFDAYANELSKAGAAADAIAPVQTGPVIVTGRGGNNRAYLSSVIYTDPNGQVQPLDQNQLIVGGAVKTAEAMQYHDAMSALHARTAAAMNRNQAGVFTPFGAGRTDNLDRLLLLNVYKDSREAFESLASLGEMTVSQQEDLLSYLIGSAMANILSASTSGSIDLQDAVSTMHKAMLIIKARLTDPAPCVYVTGGAAVTAASEQQARAAPPEGRMRGGSIASIAFGKIPWMTLTAILNYFEMYYCSFVSDTLIRSLVSRFALGSITETCKDGYVTIDMFRRAPA